MTSQIPELEPLPADAVLLHIGPYKTGSTALQQSLSDQRDVLAERGVFYPAGWRRLVRESRALMQWAPRGQTVPPVAAWDDFAADIRARDDVRVCLSTEDFGRIRNPDRSRKIVEDLGADRLHVIAVARAYHRLLPSHWQERVKSTERLGYDEWLREVFEGDESSSAHRSFWASHDIEQMTSHWLEVLPADRFTVVISDDSDRLLLSRVFESLLALPEGLLAPTGSPNASLSLNAAEVVRRVNHHFVEREWPERDYRSLVRQGAVRGLQAAGRSADDQPMPPLPMWVRPMVAERSRTRVESLRTLGLRVIGDPERLLPPDDDQVDPATLPDSISVDAAAAAVSAVVDAALGDRAAAQARRAQRAAREVVPPPAPALADIATAELVAELRRRTRRRLPGGN